LGEAVITEEDPVYDDCGNFLVISAQIFSRLILSPHPITVKLKE